MARAALRPSARLLPAAALLAAVSLGAPALARPTGHVRVVRPGSLAAVVTLQVTRPGMAKARSAKITLLVGGDEGHLSMQLKDGTHLSVRFGIHREGPGFALFATTAATGAAKRIGPLPQGGTLTFPGPGKTTLAVTLQKVATVAALRRR